MDTNLFSQLKIFSFLLAPSVYAQSVPVSIPASASQLPDHPNIVFFLADDLGWSDLGYMGSDFYESPVLDSLAQESLIFTQAYSPAPNSAPSRACMMTGLYPQRHGVFTVGSSCRGDASKRKLVPVPNTIDVNSDFKLLAEMLTEQGYACGHVGKWHLGLDGEGTGPLDQGFVSNVAGSRAGAPFSYFYPYKNKRGQHTELVAGGHPGEYLTDRLTTEALHFIENHQHEPFFLYLSQHAVHTPMQAPDSLVFKYKAKEPGNVHNNALYAGIIENMDMNLGRVLDKLEELGLSENTLFIFFSDNGGSEPVTDNWPLRGGKGQAYEGGTRVPMMLHWPGVLPAGESNVVVSGLDFYPTLAKIAGARPAKELDGADIFEVMNGKQRNLFWHFPAYLQAYSKEQGDFRTTPYSAIRSGDWKLIWFYEDERAELYNLREDLSEQNDRSNEFPGLANRLKKQLFRWLRQTEAPLPTPLDGVNR